MANGKKKDFEEIGHSGGRITIRVVTRLDGNRSYSLGWEHRRANRAGIIGVYALPQGIAVDTIEIGGIGQPWNTPPVRDCFPVFIGSDREGRFGRQCPTCDKYWRCEGPGSICPYCGSEFHAHELLTPAQRVYVVLYCKRFYEAITAEKDGDHVIDMDAVADAVGSKTDKPDFYYAEENQQNQFSCQACGSFCDILGKFGYCSVCGTRNDLQELVYSVESLRSQINDGRSYADCVRDAVSAFDAFARQYAYELIRLIPMTPSRKDQFEKTRFHNLTEVVKRFADIVDIDVVKGIGVSDQRLAILMFHRRHIYEHKGGVVDEKYIADSGDTTVRSGQALREKKESVHRLAGVVLRMAKNIHDGFHAIFPPLEQPIQQYSRLAGMSNG